MADDKEESQGEGEQSGGKKKLIILAAVCLVLVGVAVAGTIIALKIFSGAEEEMIAAELVEPESEDTTPKPAIYYPIKPAIIVNFQARGRQRFLQAELTLLLRDEVMVQTVETHMPMIRNSLIMLFGGQTYEELQTAEGKEILQEQAAQQLQSILEQETGKSGVEKVLFTSFVMQ